MRALDQKKTSRLLNTIMEFELAGVVRYTHYALMVIGPNRLPLVTFFRSQANESLLHAQQAGEILTGLDGGHPSLKIAPLEETYHHAVEDILHESFLHESKAVEMYKALLEEVREASIYLEEFARQMISNEEMHLLELRKMQRDYRSPGAAEGRKEAGAR
jgi:bacterioferritin